MWYVVAGAAVFVGYWVGRYWLAFRRVRVLVTRMHKLGEPIGRSRSEIGDVLGPPTRVPEPTPDEELAIWVAEGKYNLFGVYIVSQRAEIRLRFRDGVCVSAREEWEL